VSDSTRDPNRMWFVVSLFAALALAEAAFMWADHHWKLNIAIISPPSDQAETQGQ
jgi:hypothetical protein